MERLVKTVIAKMNASPIRKTVFPSEAIDAMLHRICWDDSGTQGRLKWPAGWKSGVPELQWDAPAWLQTLRDLRVNSLSGWVSSLPPLPIDNPPATSYQHHRIPHCRYLQLQLAAFM
ncbi:hypothetical protein FN846DRAFT_886251 [Sphaerosporella brunnea]|uniref:Uncharacterized protein n=1 Tax=Sphaerosporella brunnea TaxID=1250544 RepID=A0A5J5FAA3_9PEZI|nr:hypothetical protein FN846DRAFT_886251 [Sphaerosporella brunnea]